MDIRLCFECGEKYRPYVLSGRALCALCKKEGTKSDRKKAAYAYYADGYICCGEKEYGEATRNYTSAMEIEPEFANAYSVRGIAYCQTGEYDRAIADYNEAIERDPGFAPAYYRRRISYKKKEDRDRADFANVKSLKNLKQWVKPVIKIRCGNCGRSLKAPDEAAGQRGRCPGCGKVLNVMKRLSEQEDIKSYKAIAGHLTRGAKKRLKGTHRKTTLSFIGVLGISPKNAHSYNNRGFSYALTGKHEKAVEDYTKAITLDPKYADAYLNRGRSYMETGEYDKAIKDYTEAIELNPACSASYFKRALSYEKTGKHLKAAKDFEKFQQLEELKNDEGAR